MTHVLVPRNLDMTLFGNKADKVALILDRVYRAKMYKNAYGCIRSKRDFTEPVAISMKYLITRLHENPAPIMNMICQRHGTQPIVEVLVRVKPAIKGVSAARYILSKEYRVKPRLYRLQRMTKPVFKHDKEQMDKVIATLPENYRTVCNNIKMLSLEMTETQYRELIEQTRNKYIQDDRTEYINKRMTTLMARCPKTTEGTARARAIALWERYKEKRIIRLDEKNYDRLLSIAYKFWEVEDKIEVPIYALDDQGRLHYYLTNMPEELRPYIRLDGCKMVSYDLATSQCLFVWVTLREYIIDNKITLAHIKQVADEILETIKQCGDGTVPDYVLEGLTALKHKRSSTILDKEMEQLAKILSKDFYEDIMQTIEWKRLADGTFDRKKFKSEVLFLFLYSQKPSWSSKTNRKTIMYYFIKKFPAVYCVLWKMRRFTEICITYNQMIKNKIPYDAVMDYIVETYNTSEFPKEMQRQEADMFYNVIVPQINQPFVILHDCIIVPAGKKCNVATIIQKAFMDKYKIKVSVKFESWCK